MFANIPDELKRYSQFVVWKYETKEGAHKPTKVPYSPSGPYRASATDPSTWGTFDEACAVFATGQVAGIGFVLTRDDPFAFVDFDDPYEKNPDGTNKHGDPEGLLAFQQDIFNRVDTYAEISPSGKGLHLICRAAVPKGLNKRGVEVYTSERFMTMTGNVYRNSPISEQQDNISSLWQFLGGREEEDAPEVESREQTLTDEEVLNVAAGAENGEKFKNLFQGAWQQYYKSQSEADLALVNILVFYTQNIDQVRRLFLMSVLGKRPKAKRKGYFLKFLIPKSFDRLPPKIDLTQIREACRLALEELEATNEERGDDEPDALPANPFQEVPPGLVGSVARFIYEHAPRPVAEIALYGAIGMLAGICGRCFNVSGTGLNQYVLLLAKTGTGKEAAGQGISALMSALKQRDMSGNSQQFVGPSFIASPQALIKKLAKTPSFVSIIGEFGARLKAMTSERAAPADRGILVSWLDLYNKSGRGQVSGAMAYSDAANNVETVQAPAFSLMGESVPEAFYAAIDEASISSGLVPRFTVIEYVGDRVPENKWRVAAEHRPELLDELFKLIAYACSLNAQNQVSPVLASPEAAAMLEAFSLECDDHIRNAANVHREVWNRAHLKVLKLAALIAVGTNPYAPMMNVQNVDWAIRVERYNVARLLAKFESGEIGENNGHTEQEKAIARVFKTFYSTKYSELPKSYCRAATPELHAAQFIPWSLLNDSVRPLACFRNDRMGATNALKRAVQNLIESGKMREMKPENQQHRYGTVARLYIWTYASFD